MDHAEHNKQFFMRYHSAVSGHVKTRELIEQFVEDEKLIEHILFFEKLFPEYATVLDDLIAEGDKVFVRARVVGQHTGETEGIPATNQNVNTPFALGYTIRNDRIVNFWAIADQMELMEQLGLTRNDVDVAPR